MSSEVTDQIFNICTRANTYPYTFCSSKARFGLELAMDGRLQLHIAPILAGVSKMPQKGEKRYNEEGKACITLSHDNVIHILKHLPLVKNGTYENPDKNTDPKYKNSLGIMHPAPPGSNRQSSIITFSLLPNDPNPDKVIVWIKGQDGKNGSYMLSNSSMYGGVYSLAIFEGILRKVGTDAPYDILLQKAMFKVINTAIYKLRENPANSGGNQQGNYKQNYNNRAPQQQYGNQPQYNQPEQPQYQQPQQPQYNQPTTPQYQQPPVSQPPYVAPITAPPQQTPVSQPYQPPMAQPPYVGTAASPPQYQNVVTQNQPPQNVHHMNNDDIGNMFSDEELGL